jgi:uncharacterized protein YgiM (DUF1202 family)
LFEEEARLKKYIDSNTNLRTKATNDFEKVGLFQANEQQRVWKDYGEH